MYCDPQELVRLIRTAQATGRVGSRLAELVSKIARGVWLRYYRWQDEDDFQQEVLLRFLRYYRDCDLSRPASEIFNWLCSIASNLGMLNDRYAAHHRRKLRQYREVLGENVPEV